ncbi:hypothetical protein GWL_39060 [Herbaspirillum sp. GW103]|nr:hypothetical protein GWL_39060 [Herbaspirillum sp. GW103]
MESLKSFLLVFCSSPVDPVWTASGPVHECGPRGRAGNRRIQRDFTV